MYVYIHTYIERERDMNMNKDIRRIGGRFKHVSM